MAPGDEVAVSLDQLQTLSPKYRLQRLPYRVVGKQTQHAVLHLQADSAAGHPGSDFFRRLIQLNQSKLSVNAGRESIPGLALALRNIFLRHNFGTPLYVHYRQNLLQLDIRPAPSHPAGWPRCCRRLPNRVGGASTRYCIISWLKNSSSAA